MGSALAKNHTLTSLDLSSNEIKKRSALSLSRALALNSTLTSLNLRDTAIGHEGLDQFEASLRDNSTLRHLALSPQRDVSDARNFEISLISSNLDDSYSYKYRGNPLLRAMDQRKLDLMQTILPSIPTLYTSIRERIVANERLHDENLSLKERSFRALVRPVYEQLDEGRKGGVEYHTWLNFNSPEDGDFHFGKNNVFTSFKTFVASVKGAGVDMAAELSAFYSQPEHNPKGIDLAVMQDWAAFTFSR